MPEQEPSFSRKHRVALIVFALIWGPSSCLVVSMGGGFAVSSTAPIHWDHHPTDRLEEVTRVDALVMEDTVRFSICFVLRANADLADQPLPWPPDETYQVLAEVDRRSPQPTMIPRSAVRKQCVPPEGFSPYPQTVQINVAEFPEPSLLSCAHNYTIAEGQILGCYVDPALGTEKRQMPPLRIARVPPHQHTNPSGYFWVPLAWACDLATSPLMAGMILMFGLAGAVPGTP